MRKHQLPSHLDRWPPSPPHHSFSFISSSSKCSPSFLHLPASCLLHRDSPIRTASLFAQQALPPPRLSYHSVPATHWPYLWILRTIISVHPSAQTGKIIHIPLLVSLGRTGSFLHPPFRFFYFSFLLFNRLLFKPKRENCFITVFVSLRILYTIALYLIWVLQILVWRGGYSSRGGAHAQHAQRSGFNPWHLL